MDTPGRVEDGDLQALGRDDEWCCGCLTTPSPWRESGKVVGRYHIVGYHGGAWIFNVESNDELEMLLAQAPVYNFSHFDVYPLADMASLPVVPPGQ